MPAAARLGGEGVEEAPACRRDTARSREMRGDGAVEEAPVCRRDTVRSREMRGDRAVEEGPACGKRWAAREKDSEGQ